MPKIKIADEDDEVSMSRVTLNELYPNEAVWDIKFLAIVAKSYFVPTRST